MPLAQLAGFLPDAHGFSTDVRREAETTIKYAGYLEREADLVERAARLERMRLPEDIDYGAVAGLSREIVEKLRAVRPLTFGQAGRISGVTPAALTCLEIHMNKRAASGKGRL